MTYIATHILRTATNNNYKNERKDDIEHLSLFDIKDLYDRAYDAMDDGCHTLYSRLLMQKAITMDIYYRRELAKKTGHLYQTHTFKRDAETEQAA